MLKELTALGKGNGNNTHEIIFSYELSARKSNYQELGRQLGNPTRLMYPAGGHDIYHVFQENAAVLAIVDLVPLLFSHPTPNNPYSHGINTILSKDKETYYSLEHILNNPQITPDIQKELQDHVSNAITKEKMRIYDASGFQALTIKTQTEVDEDNLANLLGTLIVMGVDLQTVHIGRFLEDTRVKFVLDGSEKTVLFRQNTINNGLARRSTRSAEWIRNCFDEFPQGPTALIVKADFKHTAEHVVTLLQPDAVIGNGVSMLQIMDLPDSDQYNFELVNMTNLYKKQWGYKSLEDTFIGTLKSHPINKTS